MGFVFLPPSICHPRLVSATMVWISFERALTSTTVRRRCTLTWSLSATSTPESPPPLVSLLHRTHRRYRTQAHIHIGHLIYKCGGIDKRTIEKFEKVRFPAASSVFLQFYPSLPYRMFFSSWLTTITGSRRVRQGFFQVRLGFGQAKGRA